MTSGKARYNAPRNLTELITSGQPPKLRDFSSGVRQAIRSQYPDQSAEADSTFGHPADEFVNVILNAAWWAVGELEEVKLSLTKEDIRAERDNLLNSLKGSRDKLRHLSSDFDRLLPVDANPLGCADAIETIITKVEAATQSINSLPRKLRGRERQHAIAVEMAVRVLRELKGYGIKPSATANAGHNRQSPAVQILKAIGDDIGLRLSAATWRDAIVEAKRQAPDLNAR